MVTQRLYTLGLLSSVLLAVSCGGGGSSSYSPPPPPSGNPVPSITSLSPPSASAGGAAFTLVVNGTNFISSSTVEWNGSARTTSYVSGTQLTASISAADIATGQSASVTVMNPAPGGGTSAAVNLAVNDTVGGTISGLSGSGLVLQDNGGNNLTIAAGATSFTFTTTISSGNAYDITVLTQPSSPSQTCMVANGSGSVMNANVTSVQIACTTNTYTVGGTISGLSGSGLVLQDNGGNNLTIAAGATSFTFATTISSGNAYDITVLTQPSSPSQTCMVANGSGSVTNANVTAVKVTCTTTTVTYTIGGAISGLSGSGLVLQDNGGNNLSVNAGATTFTFTTPIASGTNYSVTVLTQPSSPSQTCLVTSGGGMATANVTSVQVSCSTNTYTVGGTISGLSGTGLILQDNGGDNLTVATGATNFAFTTAIASGGSYNVSVLTQPSSPSETCSVSSGSGPVTNANVTGVQILCTSVLSFSQGPNLGTYSIGDVEIPLTATGGTGSSYTWSVISGSLPPGMVVRTDGASWFPASATAGLIGIAITPGTYHFTLQVTNGTYTATQNDSLQITSLLVQDLYNLPDSFLNTSYSYTFKALNNSGPLTWTSTGGLPPGLNLSSTGVLSGTPTATGTYNIDFSISDGVSTVYAGRSLNVNAINITTAGTLPNATLNTAYSTTIQAAGGSGSYTYSASGLPSGLSMSSSGLISGTPTGGAGRVGVSVTAKDTQGRAYTKLITLDVLGNPAVLPEVAPYDPTAYFNDCTLGVPCGQGINAQFGGVEPFAWTASGLPPGMAIHWTGSGSTDSWIAPGDAELWGTPTASGAYNVKLTVTDATGASATNTFPLHVSTLELTSYLAGGTINTPYSQKLRVIGGSPSYSAQATGQWPVGLGFNGTNLTIGGTPVDSGNGFDAVFQVTDTASNSLLMTNYFSIAGAGSGAVQVTSYPVLGYWTVGSKYTNQLAACCATSYSWALVGGTLPPGLSLSATGQLSGTMSTAGNYLFSVKVADNSNGANYGIEQFSLVVTPFAFGSPYNFAYGDVSVPYTSSFPVTGGTGTVTWTLLSNNYLPPGLTLAANGTISGTPTAAGQYQFEVSIADQGGNTAEYYFSISIYPPSFYSIASVSVNCALSAIVPGSSDQCTASVSGSGDYIGYVDWTASSGSISSSGLLTAPSSNGTVTVTATSAADPTKFASTTVVVEPPNPVPTVSSLTPPSASVGGIAFTLTVTGSNFVPGSIIEWNGNNRTTAYISATELSTVITAADIALGQNAAVSVFNPLPAGGVSGELTFAVTTPAPIVSSLSPSAANAGSAGFTLTVNGSNFLPDSSVQWNGSYGQPPISTTFVSSTELTVVIPASDIVFAGGASVTVLNPAPGGGTSGSAAFTIMGTIPSNVSFVAPNGNDANPGTITLPYLTIQKCATTVTSSSTCAIRAGTYRETVTPNSGITITSYDGEPVTVDGSDPVTGWTAYQGFIYRASTTLGTGDTNQVFLGNQMMTEARWPNGNDLFHVNWATLGTGTTATELVDPNLPNINWTGANVTFWSGTDPWSYLTATVTASQAGQLSFNLDSAGYCPAICPTAGGYYFVSGVLGALDAEREWYYDSATGTLYFWAPGGVNPNTLTVTAKQRPFAFDLSNQSNVTIEYINLFATTINSNSFSVNDVINGVYVSYPSHYTKLTDSLGYASSFFNSHTTDTGIILAGTNDLLTNSTIAYSAGGGVSVVGQNNTVKNNLITHTGYTVSYASGINLGGASEEIQNNTIHNVGRIGIYAANPINSSITTTGADISYNNVFNTMMLSQDAGGFYTTYNEVISAQVHNNWFHDTQALTSGPSQKYALAGVYIDQYASGWTIDQNVLWNNQINNINIDETQNDGVSKNVNVYNNSIPDLNSTGNIALLAIGICGTTQVTDNLVFLPVLQEFSTTTCTATNNNSAAPGATTMNSSVQVGCNFAGCASSGPPAIVGTSIAASIATPPYDMTVPAGQSVMFTVTGAGSPPLTYQWLRNGANITGATSATYILSATSSADNGAVFAVTVGNSLASVTSNPATLTVQ